MSNLSETMLNVPQSSVFAMSIVSYISFTRGPTICQKLKWPASRAWSIAIKIVAIISSPSPMGSGVGWGGGGLGWGVGAKYLSDSIVSLHSFSSISTMFLMWLAYSIGGDYNTILNDAHRYKSRHYHTVCTFYKFHIYHTHIT